MNKQPPTKQVEDYEPISGGAVCLAVAVILATSFFVQSLNEENKKEPTKIAPTPQKITTQKTPVKQANYWVMHKDR